MKKFIFLLFAAALVASLAACEKMDFLKTKKSAGSAKSYSAAAKGPVVAKVNNMPVTLEDLNDDVSAINALVPQDKPEDKITTRDQKIKYLKENMVKRILLAQDAESRGLGRKDEVVRVLEKTKHDLLVVELIREETDKVNVTSQEVEDYYNNFKEELREPEERQLREIVVPTEQEAKDILIQLLQGLDFATLAKERSTVVSRKDGGDLGFIKRGKKSAQFDTAAFSDTLEVGRISNIFKGPDGYYIVKLEAKKGGKQKSLSDMYEDIKRALTFLKQQKNIEDLVGKLTREAKIEVYEGEIK